MVYKRSEYGLNFKVSSLVKNIPTYRDNLTYRNRRRELENAHTPISWLSDEEKSPQETESEEEEANKLVEKLKELKVVDEAEETPVENGEVQKEEEVQEEKKESEVEVQQETDTDKEQRQLAKKKLSKYANKENTEFPEKDEKEVLKKKCSKGKETVPKPKRIDEKTFLKKSRPMSAGIANRKEIRPHTASVDRPARGPFMSYGCGARQEIGGKQTYNVRASADVYPAAVKAYDKLQEDKRKRRDKELQTALRAKRKRAIIKEKLLREAAFWQTEYQSRYPIYSNTEYATNWERPKRCRSAFGV